MCVWSYILMLNPIMAHFCRPEPELCSVCRTVAQCETLDKASVIPRTLPSTVRKMDIKYIGNKSVSIGPEHFNLYPNLTYIKLFGRGIASFKSGVFGQLVQLKVLLILKTSIHFLPIEMLPERSVIEQLAVRGAFLTEIPYHVFDSLPNVTSLRLGFNNIVFDNCSTIGQQFKKLTKLRVLELNGAVVRKECETKIPAAFFESVYSTVQVLNLTSSNIYGGSQRIFKDFTQLEKLDISLAAQFLKCPANAAELFRNLPESLNVLIMRRWRTGLAMTPECVSTNETLFGLKQLPNLALLDMKFSDLALGRELTSTVFSGFNSLVELNIGYCRFSYIEDFAFNLCPNLSFVTLDGNPVGNYVTFLYQNRSSSKLEHLKLRRAHIYSDYATAYYASNIFQNIPLKVIDLRYNYLNVMPHFVDFRTNATEDYDLETIKLDSNYLTDLELGGNLTSQCKYLRKLKTLTIAENKLSKIKGLCVTIRSLNLAQNQLYEYWDSKNQLAIAKLEQLEFLDLSYNQITSLSADLFTNMKDLAQLNFIGNNLTTIAASSFLQNLQLTIFDMRANFLSEFSASTVQHLRELNELLLEDNQLTSIDQDLLSYVDNKTNAIKIFGLIGNPLLCDCQNEYFHEWIKNTNIVPFVNRIECGGTEKAKLYAFKRDKYTCDVEGMLIILFSVFGGIIGTVLVLMPCYKYRWYLLHLRVVFRAILKQLYSVRFEHRCTYDAYVMYNSASDDDLNWVVKVLRVALETNMMLPNGTKVMTQNGLKHHDSGHNHYNGQCMQ